MIARKDALHCIMQLLVDMLMLFACLLQPDVTLILVMR